jgi:hypothetical protein
VWQCKTEVYAPVSIFASIPNKFNSGKSIISLRPITNFSLSEVIAYKIHPQDKNF